MKIGIVGYPGAGKTTIFNALTGLRAETGPGGRTRENMGAIKVPDPRVDLLAEMHRSRKKVYAETLFVDVGAAPEGGAAKAGLSPQVIGAMQGCDALVLVLRAFENPALAQPADPLRDLHDLGADLILADLGPLEKRLGKLSKEPGKPGEKALLERCIPHLESDAPLSTLGLDAAGQALLNGFGLLSTKPVLYLLNQAEEAITAGIPPDLAAAMNTAMNTAVEGRSMMAISAQVEMDIAGMPPGEQPEFLEALGLESSARDRFVQAAYGLLDLVGFLTTGEDESRAWPIRRGTRAVKAAGKVHSDIERGFIRAEVIAYDALIALGGEKQARDAGKLRLEGKEYVVQDGDVINFRFNV